MYIDHITFQVKKIVHESQRMSKKVQTLIKEYYPKDNLGQHLQDYLKEAKGSTSKLHAFIKQTLTY